MKTLFLTVIATLLIFPAHAEEPLSRILFGSCAKQDKPMPIFETIVDREPDAFVFLGDNIYGDTEDMGVLAEKYEKLGADPGFARLVESCPVLATWDDHDYGVNDGGAEYSKKAESQRIFSDFWRDPVDSPRRKRPGVYDSRIFGPEGKRVQFILLDTRYFRGPLKTGERRVGGKYYPSEDTGITLLGEAQWKWLESELKKPADIRIIGSGIQIVPEAAGQETWSNLPHERQRLFDLIAATGANGVFIISGDRHWSEFSRVTGNTPYPIYDFTSSSFNQIHPRGTPTDNRYRISKSTYHKENFGEIRIHWSGEDTKIDLRILDIEGREQISHSISLSELSAKSNNP